jgi:hypothetical protein
VIWISSESPFTCTEYNTVVRAFRTW